VTALRAAGPQAFFDAIGLLADDGFERLHRYAKGGFTDGPQLGFWAASDLARRQPPPSQQPATDGCLHDDSVT
jgi:hypothetical protein